MPFFTRSVVQPATAFGGPIRPARKILPGLLRCYDRHLQRCRLAELDDHMLRDIGLTREQVAAECRKPFWR